MKNGKKLKNLIFDNKLIKFLTKYKEINKFELGNFDYEELESLVFIFSVIFILILFINISIRIYSVDLLMFIGHSIIVICVKNVFDDKLISGDIDVLIKIWKIETGVCLTSIHAQTGAIFY